MGSDIATYCQFETMLTRRFAQPQWLDVMRARIDQNPFAHSLCPIDIVRRAGFRAFARHTSNSRRYRRGT